MQSCFGEGCARCRDMGNGTGGMRKAPGQSLAQHVTCSPAGGGEPLKGVSREVTLEKSWDYLLRTDCCVKTVSRETIFIVLKRDGKLLH